MRLTQEIKIRGHKTYQFSNGEKASKGLTKLGQLEDIEEELGIDLITLFKALRNGIYAKDGDSWLGTELHLSFKAKALFFEFDNGEEIHHEEWFYFKDYGKTWALTREELTNENTKR